MDVTEAKTELEYYLNELKNSGSYLIGGSSPNPKIVEYINRIIELIDEWGVVLFQ